MAKVVFVDPIDSSEIIEHKDHRIQFGGPGDGYCYGHQTFDCLENFGPDDIQALEEAEDG